MRHSEGDLPAYPDLELAPIVSQERLKGWINYQIKAMPIEEWYLQGIERGCPIPALNLEFHQTVWDLIKLVRSPRKYGNLFPGYRNGSYIGTRQYPKLTKMEYLRLQDKLHSEQQLTAKEARDLHYHELACQQQKQQRLENKRRKDLARIKRPEIPKAK